jgi:hypothetical protein
MSHIHHSTQGVETAQLIHGLLHHGPKPLELLGELFDVSRHLLLDFAVFL